MRNLCRPFAIIFIADSLVTVVSGQGFLRWQRRLSPVWYRPVLDALLGWPEPSLRLRVLSETVLGGLWLL